MEPEYYFQYFSGNIKLSKVIGWITIDQFIEANKNPKKEIQKLFDLVAYYSSIGDENKRREIKEQLYSFTPCVHLKAKRNYENIVRFTGLAVLDFDKIDNALVLKQHLINEYNFILACWLSPSKRGVKALVKIPICNSIKEFKSYYYGLAYTMSKYNGFDGSGHNCVLPLFLSWDEDIFYNPDAKVFNLVGYKKGTMIYQSTFEEKKFNIEQPTDKNTAKVFEYLKLKITKIVDNGHPQVVAAAFTSGGYAAYGYSDINDTLHYLNELIKANSYLSKGTDGYLLTAKYMFEKGLENPLKFEDYGKRK